LLAKSPPDPNATLAIRAELVISERTAANHVQHVLDKLGVRSRAQLIARSVEFGLAGTSGANAPVEPVSSAPAASGSRRI
jgi:Bacterial regulatory proteins, luxR family